MGKIKFKKFITKRRIKIFLPLAIVAALVVAVMLIAKNMNGPAEGSIVQNLPTAQTTAKDPYASPGKYNGKYVSFIYPAHYKTVESQKNISYLDILNLISADHSGKNISVEVVRENLQNDSGYNHRRISPEIYKQLSNTSNSVVFTSNQNGSEQTGFITHNDLVASISLSAEGATDLSQDYNTIANSLQWK